MTKRPPLTALGLNARETFEERTAFGDGIIDLMRHHGIPITREKYLELAYFGEPPEELSAEEEANLPPMIRRMK